MDETGMMHGQDWRGEDLAGWYAAEKLDGCRAYWDGATLWSRGGLAIKAPEEVLVGLPPGFALDGELYAGPGTRAQVAAGMRSGRWKVAPVFIAFDAPGARGDYAERIRAAQDKYDRCIIASRIRDTDDALDLLRGIRSNGGEGLMAYRPGQPYYQGRTGDLVKLTAKTVAMVEIHDGNGSMVAA